MRSCFFGFPRLCPKLPFLGSQAQNHEFRIIFAYTDFNNICLATRKYAQYGSFKKIMRRGAKFKFVFVCPHPSSSNLGATHCQQSLSLDNVNRAYAILVLTGPPLQTLWFPKIPCKYRSKPFTFPTLHPTTPSGRIAKIPVLLSGPLYASCA